jgi:hypothetical protein
VPLDGKENKRPRAEHLKERGYVVHPAGWYPTQYRYRADVVSRQRWDARCLQHGHVHRQIWTGSISGQGGDNAMPAREGSLA